MFRKALLFLLLVTQVYAADIDLKKTTFIVPQNDLEAQTIIKLLIEKGASDIRVSEQGWGATLDKEPKESIQNLKETVVVVEMPSESAEAELTAKGHKVVIVDHHDFGNIIRYNKLSSLEQVAALLKVDLNRYQLGVAINDRGYIFGMLEAGYTTKEIADIRQKEMLATGMTDADVAESVKALAERSVQNGVTVINTTLTRVGYISDLFTLENPNTVRDLLIISSDGEEVAEVNFYGSPDKAKALSKSNENSWAGGDESKSMFWGMSAPVNMGSVESILGLSSDMSCSSVLN